MAYTKQIWHDLPQTDTPVNATRLNHIEDGIESVEQEIPQVVNTKSNSTTNTYSCNHINNLLEGTVLYDNSTGSNGTITLSDSASNYDYLEIYGNFAGYNYQGYAKVNEPDGKRCELRTNGSTTGNQYIAWTRLYINGTSIVPEVYGVNAISNAGAITVSRDTNNNVITKVVGYKY